MTSQQRDSMGSLQAYEVNLKLERKTKDMALKVEVRRQNMLQQEDAIETKIMLLLQNLNKLLQ